MSCVWKGEGGVGGRPSFSLSHLIRLAHCKSCHGSSYGWRLWLWCDGGYYHYIKLSTELCSSAVIGFLLGLRLGGFEEVEEGVECASQELVVRRMIRH